VALPLADTDDSAIPAAVPPPPAATLPRTAAVVDTDRAAAEGCARLLQVDGLDATPYFDENEARAVLGRRPFDLLIIDLGSTSTERLALLRSALAVNPACVAIVTTASPTVESSLEATAAGAWDYLPKPYTAAHLQILIARAGRRLDGLVGAVAQPPIPSPIGTAPVFLAALELARRAAPTDASVFLTGESGSGKEVLAHYIHAHSRRAGAPFLAVNCAAIPEALLESEMFGHRKGAFTGALRDKPGLLESADGGTLFLDELCEMPRPLQAKLLRVIQDGVVRRIGSETDDAVVDVRFICATNRDAERAVAEGELREDLLYRLRVVPIHLPPLRARVEDIPPLAEHLLQQIWRRHRPAKERTPILGPSAITALCARPWRGNVRELQNTIEHLVVLAEPGQVLTAEDLDHSRPVGTTPPAATPTATLAPDALLGTYHETRERVIAEFEVAYFTELYRRTGGNMSRAARLAGVDRTTLYRLMGRHRLHPERRALPLAGDTLPVS
jgi:DNA-binding NtrC family response regulator